jgi:adenylate cyclase
LGSDGPDSQLAASRARRQRRTALVVMLSSFVCLVVLGLILWHLVTSRILSAGDSPATDKTGSPPALAVLPFHVASDGEPLGDEIAEDLIARLSKLDYLAVVARDESFAYRTGAIDAKRVGRALAVRYVIEGSVRRAANRIGLEVRVFDARTARPVWAEEHEIELAELAAVQQRLARLIASAVLLDARPGP